MLSYYKPLLIDLFNKVQQLQDNADSKAEQCLAIQAVLIRKIAYVERRIRSSKQIVKLCKAQLAIRQSPPKTKEEARQLKEEISYREYVIDEYNRILHILRSIGDAIAFTYIPKWDIKPMALKESPGFMTGKEGLRRELSILRTLFKADEIAILNDLTNCLRHGDITVVSYYPPILLEVKKKSALNQRGRKQVERLEKLSRYLHTDEIVGLYGENNPAIMRRRGAHAPEVEYSLQMTHLILEAYETGSAFTEVEKGVVYYVEAASAHSKLSEVIQRLNSQPIAILLNTAKYISHAYYPFTLSIRDAKALYSFYNGDYTVVILVDTQVIREKVTAWGMNLEASEDPNVIFRLTPQQAHDDLPDYVDIGRHFFNRIFFEFVSLDWLLEEIISRGQRIMFGADQGGND